MNIITIDFETISIQTENITSRSLLLGTKNETIIDEKAFQKCIEDLIIKHEKSIGFQIQDVFMICNTFGASLQLFQNKNIINDEKLVIANNIAISNLNICETFSETELNKMFQIFLHIGINILDIWSVLGLFSLNFSKFLQFKETRLLFMNTKNTVIYYIDPPSKLIDIKVIEKGIGDIVEYITNSTIGSFPHTKKRTIHTILQNFICFNELEAIEKLQNAKFISDEILSSITYDLINFVSNLFKKYLEQMFLDCKLGNNVYIYSQYEYIKSLGKILKSLHNVNCLQVNSDILRFPTHKYKDHNLVSDIADLFLK